MSSQNPAQPRHPAATTQKIIVSTVCRVPVAQIFVAIRAMNATHAAMTYGPSVIIGSTTFTAAMTRRFRPRHT